MKKRNRKVLSAVTAAAIVAASVPVTISPVTVEAEGINLLQTSKATKQKFSSGNNYILMISNGEVYAWGKNNLGQLGVGDYTDRKTPTKVPGLSNVVAVVSSHNHSAAITADGSLYVWGSNNYGKAGVPSNVGFSDTPQKMPLSKVVAVSLSQESSYAITSDGSLYAWGYNSTKNLGHDDTTHRYTPTKVPGISNVTAVSAGLYHAVAATSDGKVYTWGAYNKDRAPLGIGPDYPSNVINQVTALNGQKIIDVVAGIDSTFALTSTGRVYSWGSNAMGQLGIRKPIIVGDDSNVPVLLSTLSNVVEINSADYNGMARTSNGDVYTWGDFHLLGHPYSSEGYYLPTRISILSNNLATTFGTTGQASAVTSNGNFYMWGRVAEGFIPGHNANKGSNEDIPFLVKGIHYNTTTKSFVIDLDGDGVPLPEDTNDNDPNIGGVQIPQKPTVQASSTSPTNQNVTLTVDYYDAIKKEYRINGGSWQTYSSPLTVTANASYEFRGANVQNQYSPITSYSVSNIDKVAPTTPTLTPSTRVLTNQNVTVTISYPSDATSKQYRINGGSWFTYYGAVTMTANGTVEARGIDAAGNSSAIGTLYVSNIDKTAPTRPTLTPSTIAPTNQNVSVTINYPSDATTKEYRINGGSWMNYTSAITMTENGTVEARGMDTLGNISAIGTLTISNIDKVAPNAPTLTPNTTAITKEAVIVTINYPSDVITKQYRVNGGVWTSYTSAISMTDNGTVEARGLDAAGNVSPISSLNISNISTVPSLTDLNIKDRSYDFIQIGWTLSHALSDVDEFVILRDGEEFTRVPFTANQTAYQFKDDTLAPSAMHDYTVQLIHNGVVEDTRTITASTYELESPKGLSLIKATDSTLKIGWVDMEIASNYIIKRNGVEVGRTTNPFFTDNGLTFATTYDYEVYAVTPYGVTDPAHLSARTLNELYSIMIEWDAIENAVSYNIYRNDVLLDNTTETRYVDFEVERGKIYDYVIKPVFEDDTEGESSTDFELLPEVATDIRLDITREQVVATWDDFETLYGIETPHYQVIMEKRLADGTYEMVGDPLQVDEERLVFDNFEFEADYRITVIPYMEGAYRIKLGVDKDFTTLSDIPKVENVKAELQGNIAHVTWDAFEGSSRYRVQIYVKDELTGEFKPEGFMHSVTNTMYVSKALVEGRTYKFEVIPFSNKLFPIHANFSNEVTVTVSPPVDEIPPVDFNEMYNFNVTLDGTTATLTWDEVENADRYRVSMYKKGDDGLFHQVGTNFTTSLTTRTYPNLVEGAEYEFVVEPRIGTTYSKDIVLRKKVTIPTTTVPPEVPPTDTENQTVKATMHVEADSVSITWEQLVVDGKTVTDYQIARYVKDDLTGTYRLQATRTMYDATSYTESARLISGNTYYYEVRPRINNSFANNNKAILDEFVKP